MLSNNNVSPWLRLRVSKVVYVLLMLFILSLSSFVPVAGATPVTFATNAGGSPFISSEDDTYQADAQFIGGATASTTAAISGTTDDPLYQTERYGNFSYNIPLINGNYNVTLKFAENYWSAVGKRVFSVAMNGQTVISNLDIYAHVGKNAAYDVVIPVSITNGTLSIIFTSQVDYAKVSAIKITATSSSGPLVFATNSAGPQFTSSNGDVFSADNSYSGGTTATTTSAIAGTADDTLYQSERLGDFSYTIPVTNGTYAVTLKFAEFYWWAAGQRVFDVTINGQTVLSNFDIYATVGQNAAYDITFPVSVSNGTININFISKANVAKISAIKITATSTNTPVIFATNSAGPQFTSSDGIFYTADNSYSGGTTATTNNPIDGTVDDTLYQSERLGDFSYTIPAANGNYAVTLKFAEFYWWAPGQRVFDVQINGQTVLSNFDIYATAGQNTAYDVTIPVAVTNGNINISFISKVNVAKISAILITGAGSTYFLPSDRSVQWQGYVGSTATIPATGTAVNCTQAPYNVPTDGTTDSASAIRACLNGISNGQVAYLPTATYSIKSSIYIPSNKTLRGDGMGRTIIKGATTWNGWGLVGFNPDGAQHLATSVNVSGSLTKGSTTITTTAAHNLAVGDFIIIDQLDDPNGNPPVTNNGDNGTCTFCGRVSGRSLGQINKVASVISSTAFTVEIPLYRNYKASLTPQITKQSGMIVNAGLESLTIDNSVVQDQHVGLVWYAANCWFYGVEVKHTTREGMSLIGYRNTIRNSKIHETPVPLGPNSGYGLWMQVYASANLIENNHIYRTSNPIIINGQTSGNVIAYNWLEADDQNTGRQNGAFSSHGAHPMMNLLESNYIVGNTSADFIWGSSSHYTFFRNRMQLQLPLSTYINYPYLVDFREKNWYENVIGNVLWTSGLSGVYELSSGTLDIYSKAVYVLGYTDGSTTIEADQSVAGTLLRHANYDYLNNATQWNGNDNQNLPQSLYLTGRPSWWGNYQWPAIGPDVTPMSPTPSGSGDSGIMPWNQ